MVSTEKQEVYTKFAVLVNTSVDIEMRTYLFLVLTLLLCCDNRARHAELKTGWWRAVINIQGQELPFNLEITRHDGAYRAFIRNGDERIVLDEIRVFADSVDFTLHVFDANIRAVNLGDTMRGEFVKNPELDYRIPFTAVHGVTDRFMPGESPGVADFNGMYDVTFVNERDTTAAVGVFHQSGDSVTGTFLTPVGDYRFLEGNVADGVMQLSTFDGNHAYLFRATRDADGALTGEFYSGKTWKQQWTGRKTHDPVLPPSETLTRLKDGYETLHFRLPDLHGDTVSLQDPRFRDKVVIVQLFGTWCPNCLDETRFLSEWYRANRHRPVAILALAFERKADFAYARDRVLKFKERVNVPYDFVIAGTSDKKSASATLPELEEVVAFPTTLFVGRDGKIKKIHTGFSGPGTGAFYDQHVEQFNKTVSELLNEKNVFLK